MTYPKSINPGMVIPTSDGRWGFTIVVDGKEMQAITPACSSCSEAKEEMRCMVVQKRQSYGLGVKQEK